MTLSDRDIARELASGNLVIEGCRGVGPASVDVYLGDTLALTDGTQWCIGVDGWVLSPGEFLLASTVEHVGIPDNIACQVHGCSSIGRTGLQIHTAGWVDPGFEGQLTLEISNLGDQDYTLRTGQRIAQLTFCYLNSPTRHPYRGRYQNQRGATAARPPKENR